MNDRRQGTARGAFTLLELLVVISILGMLMGIMVPALVSARNGAKSFVCMDHMRATGFDFRLFADSSTSNLRTGVMGSLLFLTSKSKILKIVIKISGSHDIYTHSTHPDSFKSCYVVAPAGAVVGVLRARRYN